MATFCGQCGFPQSTSSSFCPNCGGRLPKAPSNPVPSPPVYAPPPPPAAPVAKSGGSTALKVVLVLLVVFGLGAVAVIGGMYYVAHKVKQTVVEKAATYGVDLSSSPSSGSSAESKPLPKACDLLSQQEASNMLGEPIERVVPQSHDTCFYYGPEGLAKQLAQEQASSTFHRAREPGANVSPTEVTNSVDQLVNNLGVTPGQPGGESPLLMLIVGNDGKVQMNALKAAGAIFGGITRDAKGTNMGATPVPGLGDDALRMPKLGLNVRKGDDILRLIAGPVPDADAKTVQIARTLLDRM